MTGDSIQNHLSEDKIERKPSIEAINATSQPEFQMHIPTQKLLCKKDLTTKKGSTCLRITVFKSRPVGKSIGIHSYLGID